MQSPRLPGVAVVLMAYATGAVWFWLHPGLPRLTPSNEVTGRPLIAFVLPTAAAVLLWVFHVVESNRPVCVREPGDGAATERIVFRVLVFIACLHALVMLYVTDAVLVQRWAPQAALVLVGALLVSVGNLLPKTRPNVVVGVRTSRSLHCRSLWIEVNRAGGYVSVALGMVIIVAAVALRGPLVEQVTGVAVLAATGVLAARYRTLARGSERRS